LDFWCLVDGSLHGDIFWKPDQLGLSFIKISLLFN
jgi:hypothetical protein